MRSTELAKRNFKEVWRDPLSLGLTIGLPVLMLLVLQALKGVDEFFTPTSLVPGIALFGFVMLMFSAAMTLSRDRETALFSRLLTAPLTSSDFASAYSLPYLAVAIVQGVVLYAIGALLGLEIKGSVGLVFLIMLVMAILYVGLGMITGSLFSVKQTPIAYTVVLLLTIFGGAWFDVQAIGGAFLSVGNVFPFAHALDATRDVMINGAGFSDIATDFYWVLGYTVVTVALAVYLFRRKMLE
jgi:ABC-2 type transport system permease protein